MLSEGTVAPTVTLPGVVDGAPRDVSLDDYVGSGIVVLAFYPADFNPSCEDDSCDLTELDLFTMQRDVDIFAISTDSVFSHRAYAEEYSLSIPLLSDTHGEAVEAYDVALDSDQLLSERAVFVIDQEGVIQYAWSTADLERRPNIDAVREAVSEIGGDSTAVGRYRVGHAHYIEARRAFTSAMKSFEDRDWLIAQGDFQRAMEEFQESADQFESAVRFAESEALEQGFERAQEKATALWQAAEWLAESASEYASGDGKEADELRQDAETPLEKARDIGEPPDPDDITLDADGTATETSGTEPDDSLDAPTDPAEDEDTSEPGGDADGDPGEQDDVDAAVEDVAVDEDTAESDDGARAGNGDRDAGGVSSAVEFDVADDGRTDGTDGVTAPSDGTDEPSSDESVSTGASPDDDADGEDEDIELDLKDPTE
ncbi:redoxin domain-containing protein [Halorientalis pallida]|uniref:Redoxin domain-containing protein n=1 Tax=Halorientalis pallida TaxID=2479928 RepID=A0A498KTH8_9EURY|nr:redoxin domain-containing protein [Halorientalis pallida]RXK47354.1 redoxin domain-containing protein [Halorientalis pallida]